MPLLRRKPFVAVKPPKGLKGDDEVFFCEMTGEIFQDYEAFYKRMILCNSLVWSCELTGKANLTYKEALAAEESVKKSVREFPSPLKRAALVLVHHTCRSKIQDLLDDIYDYLKNRYQPNEKVEVKVGNKKWVGGTVVSAPDSEAIRSVCTSIVASPLKSMGSDPNSPRKKLKNKGSMLLNSKDGWSDAASIDYKVSVKLKGQTELQTVKGKALRRPKGVLIKDKLKLVLKTSCLRTTSSSDDGYWVVAPAEVQKYSLGVSSIVADPPKTPSKRKKKKKTINEMLMEAGRKQGKKEKTLKELQKIEQAKKAAKDSSERPKELTLEQKRKEYEKEKERKNLELKTLQLNKKKEKEEEKARKKNEREKERELENKLKKLELDFIKEYNKQKEDLILEDSKPLPSLIPFKSNLDQDLLGDAIMVVEFVNIFGALFDLENEIDDKVTLAWLEESLNEHDAEGKYFKVLKFLLHSYLRTQQDENSVQDDDDDASTSGENTPSQQPEAATEEGMDAESQEAAKKKSSENARAAAIWPMLHQGMALREITIEPYSLTEILRLHILSSGVRIGGITDYVDWQRRGQYQYSDDPCVSFRHQEQEIMTKMMTCSVYDLSVVEKLKLLTLLCNQALMLSTVRDFMDDAFEKTKSLRKELRELHHEENKRRRKVQSDKWKKTVEERNKLKEEKERIKKEKLEEMEKLKQGVTVATKSDSPKEKAKENDPINNEKNGDENNDDDNDERNEKTPEQIQEEKKARKEAKEIQVEEFYRDKFRFNEEQLLQDISKCTAVISEAPLGRDRAFRRYWKFSSVDGLLIENDDDGALKLTELNGQDLEELEEDLLTEDEEDDTNEPSQEKEKKAKVTLNDILNARDNGQPLEKMVLNRYKCSNFEDIEDSISKSILIKPIIEKISNGQDPGVYSVRDSNKWYNVTSTEQYQALIDAMNQRGNREQGLRVNLSNEQKNMIKYFLEAEALRNKPLTKRQMEKTVKKDPNDIDKNLFKTMSDYIEANLRDSLLELEERLWVASVAGIATDREVWRNKIEEGMSNLIQSYEDIKKQSKPEEPLTFETPMDIDNNDNIDIKSIENNESSKPDDIVVNGFHPHPETRDENKSNEPKLNGDGGSLDNQMKPIKALPLHLKDNIVEDGKDTSRCTTPVQVPTNSMNVAVRDLAEALFQIESSIERKFLKPPLGETEEIKKERLKEMLIAANADFELNKQKNSENGEEKEEEDEKKPSTVLSRWKESLKKCSSFSQIFVHLNTLDRSIMWDKSIQNAKCRVCKRKGDEDEMLLCDGCDRGFHMSCLKPPMKKVPAGDWFCHDCRPTEVKRRNRKQSRTQEETEEEESDDETEDEDADSDDDEEEESGDSEEESAEEEDEEEEESEEDSEDEGSEHGDVCVVCNNEGTLILCEDCPRSYHVECCYPPLKKVPRGVWKCQICTGADADLPYRRRAITIERQRVRAEKKPKQKSNKANTQDKRKPQQQRGQPGKTTAAKRTTKSPAQNSRPSKRAKLDSDADSQSTCSQRSSVGFSRQQLKNCTALITEISKREEADAFLQPVDPAEVPDYANFIDNPMDFGTIKRNLNKGKYLDAKSFLDDVYLVFSNCEAYNQPRSSVAREGAKLKTFVNKKVKEMKLA